MNALDNLSVYDLAEQIEAESILKRIKDRNYTPDTALKPSWCYDIKHPGNVRRLLKAGYKVYSTTGQLLITLPNFDVTSLAGVHTPILLENNKLIGL